MLINVRGAFGSGKSTIVREVLGPPNLGQNWNRVVLSESMTHSPTKTNPDRFVTKTVKGVLGHFGNVCALGTYRNNCGGVDEFSWKGAHDTICEGVLASAEQYAITLFEGQVVSGIYQRYLTLASVIYQKTGKKTRIVFVMPGKEECLRRVSERTGKSIEDPRLITSVFDKYRAVEGCWRKFKEESLTNPAIVPTYHNTTDSARDYVITSVQEELRRLANGS